MMQLMSVVMALGTRVMRRHHGFGRGIRRDRSAQHHGRRSQALQRDGKRKEKGEKESHRATHSQSLVQHRPARQATLVRLTASLSGHPAVAKHGISATIATSRGPSELRHSVLVAVMNVRIVRMRMPDRLVDVLV